MSATARGPSAVAGGGPTRAGAKPHSSVGATIGACEIVPRRCKAARRTILDGATRCVTYDDDAIDGAVRHNLEVR